MNLLYELFGVVVSLLAMTVAVLVVPLVFMVIFGLLSGFNTTRWHAGERE